MNTTPRFAVAVIGIVLAAALAIGCGDDVVLVSLAVSPATATGDVGGADVAFTVTATYSDNTTSTTPAGLTWSSSDTNVATIAATGSATCLANGVVTITATAPGGANDANVSDTAELTCQTPG